MKLPIPLLRKKEIKNYFLALLLRDDNISAVVFEEETGKIKLVGKGAEELKTSLDETSFEELLEACDKAIGTAESALPSNVETHKTVFGVKESWVEDTKIKREHLAHLKQLSEQLDLKPLGFLIFSEAIAHLLQKEEGAPISAVLIDVGTKHATATLLRAGRVVETKETKLGESIPATIDELLKTFESSDILPSRILLFNVGGSSKLAQQFISHQWSKSLPFLHVPQITLLETDFEARAILFGTAAQLGFETIDLEKKSDRKTISNPQEITPDELKDGSASSTLTTSKGSPQDDGSEPNVEE